MQPRIPRAPHPDQFEGCRPAGTRGLKPRTFDDCESSPDYGVTAAPRSFRARGPSPVPRMFEEALPHASGPKGRVPRPGRFEGSGPQCFGPEDEFSGADVPNGPFNFAGPMRGEFDQRDPHLENFDDSWAGDVQYQPDGEPFLEFRHPRGRSPPQHFGENIFDGEDLEKPYFNDSRHCDPPFSDVELGHLPLQYSDDPRNYGQNFANESFLNPPEPRVHRNLAPRPVRTRSPAHSRNAPQRAHQFDEFRDQSIEMGIDESQFEKPDIFVDDMGCERVAQMKGPRFNPPQNLRGPRAPSSHFRGQRMPSPLNTELLKGNPCSPHFLLPSTSKPLRSKVPNASEFQNPKQSRIRPDCPTKEPDIRPLRHSGPLLPTPPGGPIRFHNPRKPKPCLHELPQRPPARGPVGDLAKEGGKSEGFGDDSTTQEGETSQGFFRKRKTEESVQKIN